MKRLLKNRDIYRAALELEGKPVGGWPETQQAIRQLHDELPRRVRLGAFLDSVFVVSNGRYKIGGEP